MLCHITGPFVLGCVNRGLFELLVRLRHPPPTYGLACCSWPKDRLATKLTDPRTGLPAWGSVSLETKGSIMATPAEHSNAWFCLFMAVVMVITTSSPGLNPVWLMIVVGLIGWICYLAR